MQTTTDPLLELRDEIERRQKEALAEEDHYEATFQPIAKARAAGMWLALDKLLAHLDRTIYEAADVEKPSPVVGSSAWVAELGAALALAEEARDKALALGNHAGAKYWQGYLDGAEKAVSEERRRSATDEAHRAAGKERGS